MEKVEDAINRMLENFASLRLERSGREVHGVTRLSHKPGARWASTE